MARHHIRDNEGNLHFFNDEEYKQYRYRNGCLGVIALLVFAIGGLVSKCDNGEKSSSDIKTEKVLNTEIHNSTEERNTINEINQSMTEQTTTEEFDNVETLNPIKEDEITTTELDTLKDIEEVTHEETLPETKDDSYLVDTESLKKQQKEERKRQKQLEKAAKRKAKEEAKEAKRRAKEEVNSYNY